MEDGMMGDKNRLLGLINRPPVPTRNPVGRYGGFGGVDMGRPRIGNQDGSFSTEETVTIDATLPDGSVGWFNVPTIVDGVRMSRDDAVEAFYAGRNPPVGRFETVDDAVTAAKARSSALSSIRRAR